MSSYSITYSETPSHRLTQPQADASAKKRWTGMYAGQAGKRAFTRSKHNPAFLIWILCNILQSCYCIVILTVCFHAALLCFNNRICLNIGSLTIINYLHQISFTVVKTGIRPYTDEWMLFFFLPALVSRHDCLVLTCRGPFVCLSGFILSAYYSAEGCFYTAGSLLFSVLNQTNFLLQITVKV